LRSPALPDTPTEVGSVSLKARSGKWHELQDTLPLLESFFSKNNRLPSSTFLTVSGLFAGIGGAGNPAGNDKLSGASRLCTGSLGVLHAAKHSMINRLATAHTVGKRSPPHSTCIMV
jgi:hypothetical protein